MMRSLWTVALALGLAAAAAPSRAEAPALINYTFTYEGSDEDRLVRGAQLAAVHQTIGRFYFDNRVLVAQEVLDAYVERNMQRFIAGVTVLERVVNQGDVRLRMDIGVFARELERTLEEFRFFVRPRQSPLAFVFLQEILDDARADTPVALPLVNEALSDAGLQVSEVAVLSPDSRIDVAEGGPDPEENPTLSEALVNAQRGGVEVLFSGQSTTTLTESTGLYYDSYFFYETTLLLRMFRVDTGELLGETIVSDFGAHPDDFTAREIAIRKCVSRAVGELMDMHYDRWPYEVLGQTDYQLMVTDIDDETLGLFLGKLEDIGENARAFRLSHYHGVACVNLIYEDPFARSALDERRRLVELLTDMDTPQLDVETIDGRRITARVVR